MTLRSYQIADARKVIDGFFIEELGYDPTQYGGFTQGNPLEEATDGQIARFLERLQDALNPLGVVQP